MSKSNPKSKASRIPGTQDQGLGGRQSEKKFGVDPASISEQMGMPDFDPELRARYFKNMKKAKEDAASIESWASDGFTSGLNSVEE